MGLNVFKKARDRAFQPSLNRVSEADISAVEHSAAKSVLGRSSRIHVQKGAEGEQGVG